MKKINEIVICKDEYKSQEDFENAIRDAVMVLLNNNYIMTVNYDEKGLGVVVIEYSYAMQEYGDPYPYWLSLKERESVVWEDEK